MNRFAMVILLLSLTALPLPAGEPDYRQGENIFIETGVTEPDNKPTFYAPMVGQPHAPVFEILATRGTQGRYYDYTYAVTLKDIVKWHGHDCEGLTHAACCCKVAFQKLFPHGIVDRSVLAAITGRSPCWTDAAAFLTGARIQYGNLGFFKNKDYEHAVLLYRQDTRVAVLATWKRGINNIPNEPVVLPESATWKPTVSQQEMMDLKKVVKAAGGTPTPYQVDRMRYLQWRHINDILARPLSESYQARIVDGFRWEEWVEPDLTVKSPFDRSDIRLKKYPYRRNPTEGPSEQPASLKHMPATPVQHPARP